MWLIDIISISEGPDRLCNFAPEAVLEQVRILPRLDPKVSSLHLIPDNGRQVFFLQMRSVASAICEKATTRPTVWVAQGH